MPPIFNRYLPDPHPWDKGISEWLNSGHAQYQAIARNVMHDCRVSPQREQVFELFGQHPRTGLELENALRDFQEKRIRVPRQAPALPDFLEQSHNSANFLSGASTGEHKIGKDQELVRVIDLNKLTKVFQHAYNKGRPPFTALANLSAATLSAWLNSKLDPPATKRQQRDFVARVLDAMNLYRLEAQPYHPSWATTWEAFAPHAPAPAIRWSEVVGVHLADHSHWLIVLRYKVREAEAVVRPTQLDAGFYAFHFPSPPQSPLTEGGHPMDLQFNPAAADLVPEFIHPQIEHTLDHWEQINGGLCEKTHRECAADFVQQRAKHHQLLVSLRGPGVLEWMPVC